MLHPAVLLLILGLLAPAAVGGIRQAATDLLSSETSAENPAEPGTSDGGSPDLGWEMDPDG